jgi:hypothetical protein
MPERDRDTRDLRDVERQRNRGEAEEERARRESQYRRYRDAGSWRANWDAGMGSDEFGVDDVRGFGSGSREYQRSPYWMREENPYQGFAGPWSVQRSWPRQDYPYGSQGGEQPHRRFVGLGPKGYRRSDERIQEEINDRLMMHPDIDASDIEVSVTSGIVTLMGTAHDRHEKRIVEDIAEDAAGVDDVNNQLKVRHGFWASLTGEKASEREVARGSDRDVTSPPTDDSRAQSRRASTPRRADAR